MSIIEELKEAVGAANLLTGSEMDRYAEDWMGTYRGAPLAVVRPGSTQEVSAVLAAAHRSGTPVVPISGNTGLVGGTYTEGGLLLSLERLNAIRELRPDARLAIVEAGVVLEALHTAADAHGLVFPLTFGAKGSAMIGGALSTNAGGSNVVRYGSTRGLCLGLEVVLADGRVMDLMSELHKDNSGYDLKDLFIGAEGTLGVITAAVVKLVPRPRAYATAMVAAADVPAALRLLHHLQEATGGAVEAFEFMPGQFMQAHARLFPDAPAAFDAAHDVNIMVEVAATAPKDAMPAEDGSLPVVTLLTDALGDLLETGAILDATVAQNEAQRRQIWSRREEAAEVMRASGYRVDTDIAVPTDKVAAFIEQVRAAVGGQDAQATDNWVCHLGDGNLHYSVFPSREDPALKAAIVEQVEEVVRALGGSFSAEHGIGLSKKPSMARRKDPLAIEMMRGVKQVFDPKGILNPGKILPEAV